MTDSSRDDRITDLLLRWEEEREMGDDLPIDQLCAQCPELRDDVEQKIEALKRMAWMSGDAEEPPLPEVIVGRYKVERLLGQGGHGRVVLAFDTEFERRVAIKIPHSPPSWPVENVFTCFSALPGGCGELLIGGGSFRA